MKTSPLEQTVTNRPTDVWNDSCAISELEYAIANGAVGATTNPVIVGQVLKKEMHLWKDRIKELVRTMTDATEYDITWSLIEEMAVKGAEKLLPVFERENHRKGRISIQTNPTNYRNTGIMLDQALRFDALAPNMQVKLPATAAGIAAIEEATYHGVSINATVSFTVSQAIAVAEAVERGLNRREAEGKKNDEMSPVCTLMVGRVDDWLKAIAERDNRIVDPEALEWAGVAVMKRAYAMYRERKYQTRLLIAAFRNHHHWSQFIGGDVVLTIPYLWQVRYNGSNVPVVDRIDDKVPSAYIETLVAHFPDFVRAYEPDGLAPHEFDSYGASVRTLRSFIGSYSDLVSVIRDFMLPNPDVKPDPA
ncbi:MAG: transaldolase [Spirochaetaceae bacterium]|nr:MAG: transaldolase [Spirochaetaceae bacterium]